MPAISGWSSGMVPQPIRVGITGMPVSSANSTSRSAASALMMPPPATISGRSAASSMSRAFSACARRGRGLVRPAAARRCRCRTRSRPSARRTAGRSAPGRAGRERIRWKACWNAPGTWAGSSTVIAILVTGVAMLAMSTAWKSSLCSRATGAWPVMHRIGIESARRGVQAGDHVGAGRAGGADADADVAGRGAGVALGHVRGALDVAGQHVVDAAARRAWRA